MHTFFIAQAVSVHAARWINQLKDQGWDIHLKLRTICVKHIKLVIKDVSRSTPNALRGIEATCPKGPLAISGKACNDYE